MAERSVRILFAFAAALLLVASGLFAGATADETGDPPSTPRAACGPGSAPEPGRQGQVTADDVSSGRAAKGFTCNAQLVSRIGASGGYKVYRYIDGAGHECAYFDTTLLFPGNASNRDLTGVWVLDMTDPGKPVRTEALLTPAMQTPHESLSFNARRGILAAATGNPATYPAVVDLYDLSKDCRHPALKWSLPIGVLGHEGNFSPDGNTFYVSSVLGSLTAIDVSDLTLPRILWTSRDYRPHGFHISDDGNRLYMADLGNAGLTILDTSQVQKRIQAPVVKLVSHITWPTVSIPQTAIPVTIKGHPYVVEVDEFSAGTSTNSSYNPAGRVGAARIIDIADDAHPRVVSDLRLEVHQRANRASQASDPGAASSLQGYAGHYCAVPQHDEPGIVACSFILSGLRVFDIRDPLHPKELAYFNMPEPGGTQYAMSGPAFAPERGEVWYSDGNSGFYAVKLTNDVWPFRRDQTDR